MSITKARAYTEQELLTEIFGFIPDRIVEHIYDFINGILYEVIEGLNSRLAELCPEEEQKISEALKEFERDTESLLDKKFNKFQQYIFNTVWNIPDDLDINLDYYSDLDLKITEEHEKTCDDTLQQLRSAIVNQKKLRVFIETNLEKIEREMNQLDDYSRMLTYINQTPAKYNVTDVESSMKFVKINLDGIKDNLILAVQKLSRELDALDKNDMNARSELLRTNVKAQLNIFYRQSQQQMN